MAKCVSSEFYSLHIVTTGYIYTLLYIYTLFNDWSLFCIIYVCSNSPPLKWHVYMNRLWAIMQAFISTKDDCVVETLKRAKLWITSDTSNTVLHQFLLSQCLFIANEVDSIKVYSHLEGTCVIGGAVYRGCLNPSLTGKYIYADYGFG